MKQNIWIFGKPVVLDTRGVSESIEISDQYNVMTESIRTALFACGSVTCNDPTVKAAAQELADRVTYWLDVKSSLEEANNAKKLLSRPSTNL